MLEGGRGGEGKSKRKKPFFWDFHLSTKSPPMKRKLDYNEEGQLRSHHHGLSHESTLALLRSATSKAKHLFSVDRLLEAGMLTDMEPIVDNGDEEISDDEDLFIISDQISGPGGALVPQIFVGRISQM